MYVGTSNERSHNLTNFTQVQADYYSKQNYLNIKTLSNYTINTASTPS